MLNMRDTNDALMAAATRSFVQPVNTPPQIEKPPELERDENPPPKPDMKIFKAIFADSDDEDESE
jgi:hypothetical protein